jgi:hypothetical protein
MVGVEHEIERRLAELAALMRERELAQNRRAGLIARLEGQSAELDELRTRYAVEQRDVDRLEGLSLTRVLVALRGSREGDLDRERAEAEAARYRVAEAESRRAAIRTEIDATEARLAELAGVPARYEDAVDDKERYLRSTGGPRAVALMVLAEERGRIEAEVRELDEARRAADVAGQALGELRRQLDSAGGWSTYDTFFGGGVVSSMMKHDRLDGAARAAAYADRCLAVLRAELADVGVAPSMAPTIGVDGFTRFADVWFDNIFTDMAVREHIKRAQWNAERSWRMVGAVHQGVSQREAAAPARLGAAEAERRRLLIDQPL